MGWPKKTTRDKLIKQKALERDNYTCQCCGFFGTESHHKKLLVNGGEDCEENIDILCHVCHLCAPDDLEKYKLYKENGGSRTMWLYGKICKDIKNRNITLAEIDEIFKHILDFAKTQSFEKIKTIKHWVCENCGNVITGRKEKICIQCERKQINERFYDDILQWEN